MFRRLPIPHLSPLAAAFVFVAAGFLHAEDRDGRETTEYLGPPPDGLTRAVRETAMPRLENSHIGKILRRYYEEGLGGAASWKQVESLRVRGTMKIGSNKFDFMALQKKPHYLKIRIHNRQRDLLLGYDGETAWQMERWKGESAKPMPDEKARRFRHSARFGNHLLYPYAEGKRIEYVDTVPVDGAICHKLRVELPTGYEVHYFIDVRSYLEVRVQHRDHRTGETFGMKYADYVRKGGMPVAKEVESFEAGEWTSTLTLSEIKMNTGLMPWMFHMPDAPGDGTAEAGPEGACRLWAGRLGPFAVFPD